MTKKTDKDAKEIIYSPPISSSHVTGIQYPTFSKNMWSDRDVPCDTSKIKTLQDLIKVMKLVGLDFDMSNIEEAHEYATKEWLKENAREITPLGKALNGDKEE